MNNYLRLVIVVVALIWILLRFPRQSCRQSVEKEIFALEAFAVVVGGVDEDVGVAGEGLGPSVVAGVITINAVHGLYNFNITDGNLSSLKPTCTTTCK